MPIITEIGLEPGYYFSPGFYRDFWINKVENKYTEEIKNKHVKLKPYREMWVGAIIAAAHTKMTGLKHFVALSLDEPPDIVIAKFQTVEMPSKKTGTRVEILKIEITRCSLEDGEDLLEHILKKNTPTYKGMTLAVYLYGYERVDMNIIIEKLRGISFIYPAEIIIIGKVDKVLDYDLTHGTFAQVFIHPEVGQIIFNINDSLAFFRKPDILTISGRGVSNTINPIGTFKITPPNI